MRKPRSIYKTRFGLLLALCLGMCGACKTYKENILFSTAGMDQSALGRQLEQAYGSYIIRTNDYLKVEVFTNDGERIIDPNFELLVEAQSRQGELRPDPQYLVKPDGRVKLPVVGNIKLLGLTLDQADSVLEKHYQTFYKDPFVITQFSNKRVIVLGAGGGKVIPLDNNGMDLLEILALAGGLDNNARGSNIRLIRGDLKNPKVFEIDLTTIQGMRGADLRVMPGDVVYVEPIRRPVSESVRDIAPLLSVASTILALIVVINNLK